jgi:ABC-type branched-subunit amino acid transport system permease subunit
MNVWTWFYSTLMLAFVGLGIYTTTLLASHTGDEQAVAAIVLTADVVGAAWMALMVAVSWERRGMRR